MLNFFILTFATSYFCVTIFHDRIVVLLFFLCYRSYDLCKEQEIYKYMKIIVRSVILSLIWDTSKLLKRSNDRDFHIWRFICRRREEQSNWPTLYGWGILKIGQLGLYLVFSHFSSSVRPHLIMGGGTNFRFLVWQKSYQVAILGPIRWPICSLTNFGPLFSI